MTSFSQSASSLLVCAAGSLVMKPTNTTISGRVGPLRVRRLMGDGALFCIIVAATLVPATLRAELPWSPPIVLSAPAVNAHSPVVAVRGKKERGARRVVGEGPR